MLYLRSRAGDDPVACLWALDTGTGAERLLADPAGLPGAAGGAIGRYAVDPSARVITFALADALWTVTLGGAARRLPAREPVADPAPDPAGQRIAYLSGGALRVVQADGTGDRALAEPDGPHVRFGSGEHTGATSPDGTRGYWWAPDGARMLVARIDSAGVEQWHIADLADPVATPKTVRYASAGTANAEVTLWIIWLDGPRIPVRWDREGFEYVVGAGWDSRGPYAVVQSRDQHTVLFLGIDPASGRTIVLSEQHDDRWVQLIPGLPARTGSGAVLAHADVDGTRYLTVDGNPVTPPGLQVRAVLGVDGEDVLFTASDDPAETYLWSYRAPGPLRRLSAGAGVHYGVRRDGTLVHIARCADRPGGHVTVLRDGRAPIPVESLVERPVLDLNVRYLLLGQRELRAALFLPSWHRPGSGPLPVLADPYSGAGRQRVTAELDSGSLISQWFAEQGFAVLVADGSGTPGRGPAWEREVYGDVFGPVLDDQVTAVREAARLYPDLDLDRVGIRGWSYGGSLAIATVLRRPDVFHVAVAGGAVTDQRLYDAHWRERFLGHPDEYPGRYDACSFIAAAADLTRPLMLIHGLADENVFPAHTLRLSSALLAAGRPHEVLLLPGAGHGAIGSPVTEPLLRHQARFLARHLAPLAEGQAAAERG